MGVEPTDIPAVHLNGNPLDDIEGDLAPAAVIDAGGGGAGMTGEILHILGIGVQPSREST